jgi:hypothetical protein
MWIGIGVAAAVVRSNAISTPLGGALMTTRLLTVPMYVRRSRCYWRPAYVSELEKSTAPVVIAILNLSVTAGKRRKNRTAPLMQQITYQQAPPQQQQYYQQPPPQQQQQQYYQQQQQQQQPVY